VQTPQLGGPSGAPLFDGASALEFFHALGADASAVHYRAIHWDKNHEPKGERAVHLPPTFQPRGARLEQLQQAGYRLYWLPNGGPNDADVKACTYLFVEWDAQPMEWQVGAWQALGLPEPTVLLATGGKSIHAYWRLAEPIEASRWRPLIQRLIAYCKSDHTCKNPSRLMRLAGSSYIHKTDDLGPDGHSIGGTLGAHPARMIRHSPAAIYSAEVFEERLPELPKAEPVIPAPAPAAPSRSTAADQPRTYQELERLVSSYPQILAKSGQREEALRLVCGLARCMELIGKGKADAVALASRYHPQAADTFEQIDRWKFDQFDAGSFIKQCKGVGVDVKRHDIPKPAPPTMPMGGEQFIPIDEAATVAGQNHDYVGDLDDEARQELLAEIRSFRERLATRVSLDQVFPPGIASAITTYAAQQGLAPEGFILPILCAAASIMGNRVSATPIPGDDWTEPSILWGINIAVAGGGKTPISRASIEKPLLPWQIREREKHAEALRRWKHDRAQAEREAKAAANEVGGSDSDPLEEFLAENPQPARRHLVINDATFEKLEMILENGSTPGLLAYHDEMGQWFSQLCRNPQASDRTKWLSLYPGSSIVTDRVGRDDVLVPHPAVSLMGNLQPARMQGLWAVDAKANDGQPDGDGLWSRFLMQPLPDWDYTFGAQPAQLWPALATLYEQIDAAVPPAREDGGTPHCIVHISGEALPLFGTWVNDVRDERKTRTSDEDRQYLAKGRGSTLRIALVLHAITQSSCGMPITSPMSLQTIRGAVLLSLHYMTQRDQVMASLNPNHPAAAVKRLLARGSEWIQANGTAPVSLSQIRQWALPKRSCSSAERQGWLQQIVENTPGCGQIVESRKSIAWLPPAD
jgi:hypothetical protein